MRWCALTEKGIPGWKKTRWSQMEGSSAIGRAARGKEQRAQNLQLLFMEDKRGRSYLLEMSNDWFGSFPSLRGFLQVTDYNSLQAS